MTDSLVPDDDDQIVFTPVPTASLRRDGWTSPVMRNVRVVGHRHRFDNRLLYAACYCEPMTRFTRREGD